MLLESGRIPEAITELELAVELNPDDCATHLNLGLALARGGALARAEAELRKAELIDPTDPEIPYNLGAVLWRRSDYPRAASKFRRALVLDPRHEEARRWFPRTQRAVRNIEQQLLQGNDKKEEGNK